MSDTNTVITGGSTTTAPAASTPIAMQPNRKGLDLAVLKKGAKDYLDFLDATKEIFYAYLYHRTGSQELSKTLLSEIYLDVLSRAMSLWWFGTLSLKLVLDTAERILKDKDILAADLDTVYLPSLAWLKEEEKKSVATLHDALWTLPKTGQQFLILSLLIGLSDERIAQVMRVPLDAMKEQLRTAKEFLITRWQPTPDVLEKIQSLVFVPALDLQAETRLRFSVVEKYNALRFRRYQWVVIGGLFALMSNVIVAGLFAFAVIVKPAASLKGTRTQVASLDAVLLEREMATDSVKQSLASLLQETKRIDAYDSTRTVTKVGLGVALDVLQEQQKQRQKVVPLIRALERARTAFHQILGPIADAVEYMISLI